MAATSIQEQVDLLVTKKIAEAKVRGAPASDIESAAVFESIGLNLLLNPRTVLYAANLARNGVLAAVSQELAQISSLMSSVQDTGNQTLQITGTAGLERAKTALLQMEDLSQVDPDSQTFRSFTRGIDDFLETQLAKNVRKPKSTGLSRTGVEASQDVATDFATLKSLHTSFLDKMYALAVGVDNFISSPMGTILGVTTAYRVRSDIQSILDTIEVDSSGSTSKDFATRLITSRAALKLLGAPPNIFGPVLDSVAQKPDGYALVATSNSAAATAVTSSGPFSVSAGSLSLSDGVVTETFPTTTLLPSGNAAAIYSSPLSFPLTIPGDYHLFLKVVARPSIVGWVAVGDGTFSHPTYGGGWVLEGSTYSRTIRAPLGENSTPVVVGDISSLASTLTASLGVGFADAGTTVPWGTATIFNGDRLVIYGDPTFVQSISVSANYAFPYPVGTYGTAGVPAVFALSAHTYLGLQLGQVGVLGQVPAEIIVEALSYHFSPSLVAVTNTPGDAVAITTVTTVPGTVLLASGSLATDLGLASLSHATSNTLSLHGTVFGVAYSPFNPTSLVQVGDVISTQEGTSVVTGVFATEITLADALQTFSSGNVTVTSSLVQAWGFLSKDIDLALNAVLQSKFGDSLDVVDQAVAVLSGSPTPGSRNAVLSVLTSLQGILQSVVSYLSDPSSFLPVGSATIERKNADSVVAALLERKYDKAADFFMQCRIQELFEMDYFTASYSGSMMRAATDVAQSDIRFPDRTKDEDTKTILQTNRRLIP